MVARWQAEERATLEKTPPRYAVVLNGMPVGPDSAAWFAPLGYVQREVLGPFVILEHVPEQRGTP